VRYELAVVALIETAEATSCDAPLVFQSERW
jgi:hypothetical protein